MRAVPSPSSSLSCSEHGVRKQCWDCIKLKSGNADRLFQTTYALPLFTGI
jgi:hypothetical protein